MRWYRALPCILVASLLGCALPAPVTTGGFVPEGEISAVEVARDGLTLYSQGRYSDAELRFRQALLLFPEADNVRTSLALALSKGGLHDEATELMESIAVRYPDSPVHAGYLAQVYANAGRYAHARRSYERGVEMATAQGGLSVAGTMLRELALLDFTLGREEDALCHSAEAVSLDSSIDEMVRHSRMLLAAQRFEQAKGYLQNVIDSRPEARQSGALLTSLSAASYALEGYRDALTFITEARDTGSLTTEDEALALVIQTAVERRLQSFSPDESALSDRRSPQYAYLMQPLSQKQLLEWPPSLVVERQRIAAELRPN